MKCTCCQKEKEIYVTGICRECADAMDKYFEGDADE